MTTVPLPDTPCVRVRLIYNDTDGNEMGNRFYLSYSGSAPSAANCATLASDISTAWGSNIKGLVIDSVSLVEIDVLDIATNSGLSGNWTGTITGTNGSGPVPIQAAINVEFGISRRYRGGKPRWFLPPANNSEMNGLNRWTGGFISTVNTDVAAFFTAVEALSVGSMGTLQHVNLSYYKGFTNITNSSGRERAVPTYRTVALHDNVTSYIGKVEMGSQKRRRTSTSP
jgi:hypothetical protein